MTNSNILILLLIYFFLCFLTVEFERGRRPGGGTQPAVVLSGILHPQVLDDQDPLTSVHDLLVAAALWQLLVSSVPGDLGAGL